MNQYEALQEITRHITRFVTFVKGLNALQFYGINYAAESIYRPFLSIAFDLPNLRNLNTAYGDNYPAIDLADESKQVCFQITFSSDVEKVKYTLEKFKEKHHDKEFEELYVFIISEKQDRYTSKALKTIASELPFEFDPSRHIIDYRDLLKRIEGLDFDEIEQALELAQKHFGNHISEEDLLPEVPKAELAFPSDTQTEILAANWSKVGFPDRIFVAELSFDRKTVVKNSKDYGRRISYRASARQVVYAALEQNGVRFTSEWVTRNNKLITFHNLHDEELPLRTIVDIGTISEEDSCDYFQSDDDASKNFSELLRRCFGKICYDKGIDYDYKSGIYYYGYSDEDELGDRKIQWVPPTDRRQKQKPTTRTVIKVVRNKKNKQKVYFYKHLAFSVRFIQSEEDWYIQISPDWHITWDGFQQPYYAGEKVSFYKKLEKPFAVYGHYRFLIEQFRSTENQVDMFSDGHHVRKDLISLEQDVNLEGHPYLNDDGWLGNEAEDNRKALLAKESEIQFDRDEV